MIKLCRKGFRRQTAIAGSWSPATSNTTAQQPPPYHDMSNRGQVHPGLQAIALPLPDEDAELQPLSASAVRPLRPMPYAFAVETALQLQRSIQRIRAEDANLSSLDRLRQQGFRAVLGHLLASWIDAAHRRVVGRHVRSLTWTWWLLLWLRSRRVTPVVAFRKEAGHG
jgi:hypothetical protein